MKLKEKNNRKGELKKRIGNEEAAKEKNQKRNDRRKVMTL